MPKGESANFPPVVPGIAGQTLLPGNMQALQKLDVTSLGIVPGIPQQALRPGPCVGAIGNFIFIGLNSVDHAKEAGMTILPEPIIFNKWTSAICGPNDPIQIPRGLVKTDWEVELGVVIGKPRRLYRRGAGDESRRGALYNQ